MSNTNTVSERLPAYNLTDIDLDNINGRLADLRDEVLAIAKSKADATPDLSVSFENRISELFSRVSSIETRLQALARDLSIAKVGRSEAPAQTPPPATDQTQTPKSA